MCAIKYFCTQFSKITFGKGKCSDVKSVKETGFLARLSSYPPTHKEPPQTQMLHRHTLMTGVCVYLPPWVGTEQGTSLLSSSASHLSAMPHRHISCHLCPTFPLHHHRSSGLGQCKKVHPTPCLRRFWLWYKERSVLTTAGLQAYAPFPDSATSHHTRRNIPGWLLPHLPTGGARKRNREKAEINSSLTLLKVLPACQIIAPW